jgi:hypothetical protein
LKKLQGIDVQAGWTQRTGGPDEPLLAIVAALGLLFVAAPLFRAEALFWGDLKKRLKSAGQAAIDAATGRKKAQALLKKRIELRAKLLEKDAELGKLFDELWPEIAKAAAPKPPAGAAPAAAPPAAPAAPAPAEAAPAPAPSN